MCMNRKFYVLHDVKCRVVVQIKKRKKKEKDDFTILFFYYKGGHSKFDHTLHGASKGRTKSYITQLEDCHSKFPETDSFKVQQSEAVT